MNLSSASDPARLTTRALRTDVLFCLVLALAILLRTCFLKADLPFVYDPDEPIFVDRAMAMLRDRDPNPHWFGAPASTTIYPMAAISATLYGLGRVTGHFHSPEDFRLLYHTNPTLIYLAGRLATALFGIACVVLTFMIGRRLESPLCGLLAALLLPLNRRHILYPQLIRMDVPMPLFLLRVFWYSLNILERGYWRDYLLAGSFLGLGVTSKYPAALSVAVIILSHVLRPAPRL